MHYAFMTFKAAESQLEGLVMASYPSKRDVFFELKQRIPTCCFGRHWRFQYFRLRMAFGGARRFNNMAGGWSHRW
eukprot:8885862-Pyramimonas_sp.AAC.1